MKKLIFSLTLILTFSSFGAGECIDTYREGYLDLRDVAVEFNSGMINRFETVSMLGLISTETTTQAGFCQIAQISDRSERNCASDYKSLYKRLRNNINTLKITTGAQKDISFATAADSHEDEGLFGRTLRNSLSFGTRQIQRGELAIIDARCSKY
jgi:hypothetical protein